MKHDRKVVAFIIVVLLFAFNSCNDKTTEPDPDPLILTLIPTQVSTFGGSDGAIDLTVSGGTQPYTYHWSNETTTEDIYNLSAGIYSVTVTDSDDLFASDSTEIIQPDEPEPVDILERLQALPGIEVVEIDPENDYPRQFEIYISQPVDHQNPGGQQFVQRMYLSHRDESEPMIFAPSGYSPSPRSRQEMTYLLPANQLVVTHRYLEGAQPQSLDWQYLNISQAAADHHRIVTLFKQIYDGIWISSGGSKSGLAALFHYRFYPDDVQAVITYSAPLAFSAADPRFDLYLLEVAGDEDGRNRIRQFQRAVLENRQTILPLVVSHLEQLGSGYSLGEDLILEFAVLEYPFYFWSFGSGDCAVIPDSEASAEELLAHLLEIIGLYEYTDAGQAYFQPVYYQLFTEIGYYRLITDHLADLLEAAPPDPSHLIFAPDNEELSFDPEAMQDINTWLQTEGDNIIYIYGGQDSWTAAAIELTGQTNALKIVQPGANHFVRITDLDDPQLVYLTLEQWLGIEIEGVGMVGYWRSYLSGLF
ncbi:MAG: hypothetical protein GY869_13250 [Planctomycetes bacterium]|nr:hypothetical protein [Planctomycetota bacterium]